jgi:hemolysin activation/secretion protein
MAKVLQLKSKSKKFCTTGLSNWLNLISPCKFSFVLITTFALNGMAGAQLPPPTDAGRILEQIQQAPAPTFAPTQQPEIDIKRPAPSAPQAPSGISFLVTAFEISGNTVITTQDLQAKLKPLVGKKLTLEQLRSAADELANYYRSNGYLVARAILPPQQVTNGVVKIEIVEGRRDKINFKSIGDPIVNSGVQVEFVSKAIPDNAVISEAALERALMLIGDTPGVSNVQSSLEPGSRIGTSDLNIVTTAGPRFFGSVDADNFGGRYSGSNRVGTTLGLNSLSGIGDQLTLRAQTTGTNSMQQGSQTNYARIAYQIPVGSDGLKVGVAYAAMRYQLGLNYQGTATNGLANTASIFTAYPFVRSRNFNLYGQAGYDNISMVNNSFGFQLSQLTVNQGTVGFSGNSRDSSLGGGLNSFGAVITYGNTGSSNAGYVAVDNLTAQTLGSFSRYNFNFSRLQAIDSGMHFVLNTSAQVATQNLNSSQLFMLGGPSGVRAYPVGQAAGSQGLLVQLELHKQLLAASSPIGSLTSFVFYDYGAVELFKNTWSNWSSPNPSTGQSLDNRTSLQGAGLGFRSIVNPKSYINLTLARAIGQSQSMRVYGVNANGLTQNYTFYVQGVLQF